MVARRATEMADLVKKKTLQQLKFFFFLVSVFPFWRILGIVMGEWVAARERDGEIVGEKRRAPDRENR